MARELQTSVAARLVNVSFYFGYAVKNHKGKGKGKAILLQTLTDPEVSMGLGLPDSKTIST